MTCKRSGRSIPLPRYRLTITTVSTPRVLTSACSLPYGNLKRHRGSTGFPACAGSHPTSRCGAISAGRGFAYQSWRFMLVDGVCWRGRSRCDDGVYAGTGIYGTTGRLGEALIVKLISKVMTNEKLPDALRLSGLQCVLQFTDFFGSCRPDKAFTPHPA